MHDCMNVEEIQEIRDMARSASSGHGRLEDAILRMAQAHERQSSEIREMTQTITAHMIDNREFRVNLERAKEERDVLFTGHRDHEKRLSDCEKFDSRLVGGLYLIPTLCTIIVVFLTVLTFIRES